jgi:predicted NBD/HSP70 family sugar kinase
VPQKERECKRRGGLVADKGLDRAWGDLRLCFTVLLSNMIVVPSKMGRLNKRALLARLQRMGVASRADLAKSLGMSQPTAGKIAEDLLRIGVLEELEEREASAKTEAEKSAPGPARLGRPGRMLRLNRSSPRFLGIQLGVNETKLAALPVGADMEDHWSVEVKTPSSAKDWARALRGAKGKLLLKGIWGVLVSVPGVVDEQAGRVLFSPNLHWTETTDLPGLVRQVWGAPAVLVQEERALALGHQFVEPDSEDFLLVDFGEGVGGAVIVGGKLYANPLPLSGEFGHTPVLGNSRPCGCGATGCLETLVSTRGLLESLAGAQGRAEATWNSLVETVQRQGIERWLAETLDATAVVIAGALNVLGLRRVVITGSPTELPSAVLDHLTASILRGSMWARFGEVHVHAAPRRRTAGMVAVGIDRLVLPMTAQSRRREEEFTDLAV